MVRETVHSVGDAVIADVCENEDIFAAGRVTQNGLALSGSEAGTFYLHQIILFHITVERGVVFVNVFQIAAVLHQKIVNILRKREGGVRSKKLHGSHRHSMFELFCVWHITYLQGLYIIMAVTCQADLKRTLFAYGDNSSAQCSFAKRRDLLYNCF